MKAVTSEHVPQPWRPNIVPEGVEERFVCAALGHSIEHTDYLRAVAEASAYIRTMHGLELMREALRGRLAGKQLEDLLRRLGRDGRSRLGIEIDPRDFVRANVTLLLGSPPMEVEDLVTACVEYGEAAALSMAREIHRALKRTADGRRLLMALGVSSMTTREAAKKEGKSHVAIANKVKGIKARLSLCRR